MPAHEKQTVDWATVEAEYRVGHKSVRQIARDRGVSAPSILQRAKRDNWPRDLQPRITAEHTRKQSQLALKAYRLKANGLHTRSEGLRNAEIQLVSAMADLAADATEQHRLDVSDQRQHVRSLAIELSAHTTDTTLQDDLRQALATVDDVALRNACERVVSLPGRVAIAGKLAEALEKLVTLERKVLRIHDDEQAKDTGRVTVEIVRFAGNERITVSTGTKSVPGGA